MTGPELQLPTRQLKPEVVAAVKSLKAGDRVTVTQTIRVGARQWQTTVSGTFRLANYLATGLATERVREDDIVVPVLHFTKDNGELTSVTLDEHSVVLRG